MGRIKRTAEEIQADIESQSKVCCVCEKRKPFDEFYNYKNRSDGKSYRCKACDAEAKAGWAERNPKRQRESQRRRSLWSKYRLRPEDYDKMLEKQGGGCAICGLPEQENKVAGRYNSLSVDHDHDTGEVRGLLCNQCNRGVGMLQDSPVLLRKAADYLDCH